jgi:hypothetical protein
MNRREAVIRMALLMGASALGPRLYAMRSADAPASSGDFSGPDLALLDEIGETVIPETHTPGARSVGIGAFIAMMVTDCYYPVERAVVMKGLHEIRHDYRDRYGEEFVGGEKGRRTAFLSELDAKAREQRGRQRRHEASLGEGQRPLPHLFRILKELTLLGYFTSEFAQTKLFDWVEVPGRFDGDALRVQPLTRNAATADKFSQ